MAFPAVKTVAKNFEFNPKDVPAVKASMLRRYGNDSDATIPHVKF